MKKLALIMAMVFMFGATYAVGGVQDDNKPKTEQTTKARKDKKEAGKAEKKEECSAKKEGCCADKAKSGTEKKANDEKK